MHKKSPWAWVPTLYFAEGLPYVAVMTISLIMYKRLGLSNADITLYTSWLYLPWVIKPLWSPFIDIIKTKRWWIVAMQLLIGAAIGGVAFTIGKELEIRRALSETHLYSSAFDVEKTGKGFRLNGKGWGHGVGLCQIGAAVMGEAGKTYDEILLFYYRHAEIQRLYE